MDFDELQLRIHPAASRVAMLAKAESGVGGVLRSALRRDEDDLLGEPFRRSGAMRLEERCWVEPVAPLHLTPATDER